jgi:hypothetical protein
MHNPTGSTFIQYDSPTIMTGALEPKVGTENFGYDNYNDTITPNKNANNSLDENSEREVPTFRGHQTDLVSFGDQHSDIVEVHTERENTPDALFTP